MVQVKPALQFISNATSFMSASLLPVLLLTNCYFILCAIV